MNETIYTDYRTRIKRVEEPYHLAHGIKTNKIMRSVSYVVESCDLAGEWHPTKTTVYLSTAKHYARLQASGLYQSDQEARRQSEAAQAKYQRENPNG